MLDIDSVLILDPVLAIDSADSGSSARYRRCAESGSRASYRLADLDLCASYRLCLSSDPVLAIDLCDSGKKIPVLDIDSVDSGSLLPLTTKLCLLDQCWL